MKHIGILSIVLVLMGCSPVFETELKEIADLKQSLVEAQKNLESFDLNAAKDIKAKYFEITEVVDAKYLPDTSGIDQSYARMRNYYKGIKKAAGSLTLVPEEILNNIAVSTTQLEMLEADIKNGAITNKDSVRIFIDQEKEFVNAEIKEVEIRLLNFKNYQAVHDSAYPYFVKIADSLNKIR